MGRLKKILDVFFNTFAFCVVAFIALCMMVIPIRDLLQQEEASKRLTPQQESDYSALLASKDDEAIAMAAYELFKRPDLAGVRVWKGELGGMGFQVDLTKPVPEGFLRSSAPSRYADYNIQLTYLAESKPADLWAIARSLQQMGSAMGGFLLLGYLFFQIIHWWYQKQESNDPNLKEANAPMPPADPNPATPLPPQPKPKFTGLKIVWEQREKSQS